MLLNKLEIIYRWINNLSSNTKTIIIMILVFVATSTNLGDYSRLVLEDYRELIQEDKELAEEYTRIKTPLINQLIEGILQKDRDASNVLLLNYHNTLTSTHGFSYRFLTTLTEKKRGLESKTCRKIWKELEYVNYGEEIERINSLKFLRIDSIPAYRKPFPNFTELLELSGAKSAGFYPIRGIDGYIGMIVILYPNKKEYELGYYQKVLSDATQDLPSILDYNSAKEKFKMEYGNRQKE